MENLNKALKSKTVWLALFQAAAGVLVVVLTEADLIGYAALVKSFVDIVLRGVTTKPLSEK